MKRHNFFRKGETEGGRNRETKRGRKWQRQRENGSDKAIKEEIRRLRRRRETSWKSYEMLLFPQFLMLSWTLTQITTTYYRHREKEKWKWLYSWMAFFIPDLLDVTSVQIDEVRLKYHWPCILCVFVWGRREGRRGEIWGRGIFNIDSWCK